MLNKLEMFTNMMFTNMMFTNMMFVLSLHITRSVESLPENGLFSSPIGGKPVDTLCDTPSRSLAKTTHY